MPASLWLTRRTRVDLAAALLLSLTALTLFLPVAILLLRSRPTQSAACRAIPRARASLYDAIITTPHTAVPLAGPHIPEVRVLTATALARSASARLQALVGTCGGAGQAPAFRLPEADRAALEFATLSRYPIDGVLQYILGLIGVRNRKVVELEGSSGAGLFYGSAALSAYNGFNALVALSLWTGFNEAQQYYEGVGSVTSVAAFRKSHFPDSAMRLDEADFSLSNVDDLIRQNVYGGDVDVLFAVLDGSEYALWEKLSAAVPRVVVMFYQDYWGATAKVFRSKDNSPHVARGEVDGLDPGRRRLYTGASLAALIEMGSRHGYRLTWCLRAAPIAIFVIGHEHLLPTVSPASCLAGRASKSWQRDMEAQWHIAQRFAWTKL